MPTTFTYTHIYLLGSSTPTASTPYFDFGPGIVDVIDDQDGNPDGSTVVGGTLSISANSDVHTLVGFTSNGDPVLMTPSNYFVLSNNPSLSGPAGFTTSGGPYMYCFAEGTAIATPQHECLVQDLQIGDLVCTSDGRNVPVKWIGRQTIAKLFAGEKSCLVRIKQGALGNHSDLYVTADHGMLVDGLVINAGALVNGREISFVPLDETPDRQIVYHIETEDHDVIFANGALSETFVDAVVRSHFDNYQEYLDLYGTERLIPEMDRPRISSARLVPQAIKDRIKSTFPKTRENTAA